MLLIYEIVLVCIVGIAALRVVQAVINADGAHVVDGQSTTLAGIYKLEPFVNTVVVPLNDSEIVHLS